MSAFKLRNGTAGAAAAQPAKRIAAGTEQQERLWAELNDGSGHVLAEARAGCGKSSSCREGMWRVLGRKPGTRVTYTVFNKQNADEFRADCPPGVEVGTVHSLGNVALKKAFGSQVEKNKTYMILDDVAGPSLQRYFRRSVASLVSQAKNQGLRPDQPDLEGTLRVLLNHYDINAYGKPQLVIDNAVKALARSAGWTELIDFDDMVWLPGLHELSFPACDLLFLDEVQDWNPAQHLLVRRLCAAGRVVAVGDRYQAIYAFRGADPDSIPRLSADLGGDVCGLAELPLTVTFRCPHSHVAMARAYVPDLQAHPRNPEGEVETGVEFEVMLAMARPGDMVLSPTNAPLVKGALSLISQRRQVVVRGRAIGDQLVTVYRRCSEGCRTVADAALEVDRWKGRELSRLAALDGMDDVIEQTQDRASGLLAILSACDELPQVEPTIARLFSDDNPAGAVVFSTVHRAKGLEAERVWLLEVAKREANSDWEARQQRNLRYVALTRSKDFLALVEAPETN